MPDSSVTKPPMKLNIALRKCLTCGEMFESDHIGNRRCKPCKNSIVYEAASAFDEPQDVFSAIRNGRG